MKELTKSEEQMMDIFWDSKEALTSVDIVKNAGESNLDKWAGT